LYKNHALHVLAGARLLAAPRRVAVPRKGGVLAAVRRLDDVLVIEEAELQCF
jgi:hypothetical protein